jgi:hypothetical protein
MLILIMGISLGHIEFQLTLNLYGTSREKSVGRINYLQKKNPRKFMWVILLCCATFVMKLIFDVSVESLHVNLGDRPEVLDPS